MSIPVHTSFAVFASVASRHLSGYLPTDNLFLNGILSSIEVVFEFSYEFTCGERSLREQPHAVCFLYSLPSPVMGSLDVTIPSSLFYCQGIVTSDLLRIMLVRCKW